MKEKMGQFNSQKVVQPVPLILLHPRQAAGIILTLSAWSMMMQNTGQMLYTLLMPAVPPNTGFYSSFCIPSAKCHEMRWDSPLTPFSVGLISEPIDGLNRGLGG